MTLDEALSILSSYRDEIRSFGVKSIAIFGSVARNEAGPDSDIDVLVEFDHPVGYFTVARLQDYLSTLLGRRVDLVMRDAIKQQLRDRILKEAVLAA